MARTIVIFSTKGGVGKTLLGANISVALSKYNGKSVCLLDCDLQVPGDMARMFNLEPGRTMADWAHALKKGSVNLKKESFITQSLYGLDFLPAVLRPQQAASLEPRYISEMFHALDNDYDYIIVDAGKTFSDQFVSILSHANLILLVVTPDILAIYQTKWILDTLQSLFFPLKMIKIVLNRASSLSSIHWQEVQAGLPCEIIARISSEGKIVGRAVNQGTPVVIDSPTSKVALEIKKLSSRLVLEDGLFLSRSGQDAEKLGMVVTDKPSEFWAGADLTETCLEITSEERDEVLLLKRKIHARLIDELNIKRMDLNTFCNVDKARELRNKAEIMASNFLAEEAGKFIPSQEVRKRLVKDIIDEALGLGPLEDLLEDTEISDIMVNNKDQVYIERKGKIDFTSKRFMSNDQVRTVIERIIAPIGRRIDESTPMVDARLPDGSRVNAIIPPLSLTGPTLTIRKFRKEAFEVDELINLGTLNRDMGNLIQACVAGRRNIIVSGGTGSGKTTVLNVLSKFIPEGERIVTIEDAAELRLHQRHWVRLESRAPNIEGKGAITARDLFRNTLRMRPDRIIIGECRSEETLDMLQAMNTGHDGSMTTVHANSTHDVISRLDSMILMSGVELPLRALREMIASAINLIIHTARLSDGSRKIMQITEVAGMTDQLHIMLEDIFVFKQSGIDRDGKVLGEHHATGYKPRLLNDLKVKGIPINEAIFKVKP